MDGLPVIIRLIDPPLHEFLPDIDELMHELADLKIRMQHAPNLAEVDSLLEQIRLKETPAQAGQGAATRPTRCSACAACAWAS